MDVNNTPYCLLRSALDFAQGSSHLQWNRTLQALTLAQNQSLRLPASDPAAALAAWQTSPPLALDSFNQIGRLSSDRSKVEFNSGRSFQTLRDGELAEVTAPAGTFTDMALGGDGRLALPFTDNAGQHGLVLFHLARRWQTSCALSTDPLGTPLPPPRRVCVDIDNRIWLICASHLLLCSGEPLPLPYNPQPARFEPERINPHELQLQWVQPLPAGWEALALCCDFDTVYLLAHDGAGVQAIFTRPRSDRPDSDFIRYTCASDVPFVIDLALATDRTEEVSRAPGKAQERPTDRMEEVSRAPEMAQERPTDSSDPVPGRLAALAPRQTDDTAFSQRDATILELRFDAATATGSAQLVHERYPLLSLAVPRFVTSADGQLRYQAEVDPDFLDIAPRPRELHALRRPHYYLEATALLHHILDSGQPDTHWHRLYLDAHIPPGCSIQIGVRVYATPDQRGDAPVIPQPEPVWNPLPSELPFADSLAEVKRGTSGLFEILLQRPDGPVRRLSGRYLQLQITLRGNGRQTPCLHAIRVYYPRFSYQEAYLPEMYRQELSYDPDNATGPANGPDIRERLLAAFEGVLTPLEGRIAAGEQLVHPDATLPEHLPWLAEVLGTRLPSHWPVSRQRRLVRETTLVQQFKGTLYGVQLALDIASDGGVRRGEVVLVENFRLRRTMATILGISMDDADHPLTLGTGMSGNSIIGDSLILSESDAREFLALFSPELATKEETADGQGGPSAGRAREGGSPAVVKAFFEQYAHQVTVLLHGRGASLRSTVADVLAEQMPAHLEWRVFETEHPFVLGIAPLLAVDTFIETTPDCRRVTLNDTYLGQEGILKNPAAFSPADINATSP